MPRRTVDSSHTECQATDDQPPAPVETPHPMDPIATKPATPYPLSSGLGCPRWRRPRIMGVAVLATLSWIVFFHGRLTGSAHAAYAALPQLSDRDELPRRSEFSAFLRQQAPPELWVRDVLGRWRMAKQPARQLAFSLELSLWLERELASQSVEQIQTRYPELATDPQDLGDGFAAVQLVWARLAATQYAQTALDQGLRVAGPDRAAEVARLRDLQRELRLILDRFDRLGSALAVGSAKNEGVGLGLPLDPQPPASPPRVPEVTADEPRSLAEQQLQQRQVQQLRDLATGTLAWLFYYEWLLDPDTAQADLERVRQAQTLFMRLLGISATDLQTTDLFRWYDPTSPAAADQLLGLGLCSASLGQAGPATTCFATLQQRADPSQSQRVLLWQIHNALKRNRWEDALLLASAYLQATQRVDDRLATQMVETMLRWFSPEPTGSALVWQWRILELLIQRGQVETTVQLVKRYELKPGPGLYGQVLALHQLLTREPLERLTPGQLQQVAERLEPWTTAEPNTTGTSPPVVNSGESRPTRAIKTWAIDWLARVRLAEGKWDQAQQWLAMLYEETPADQLEQRQQLAWQVAAGYERSAALDWAARQACLEWFQRAADVANLPLSAAAEVKVRLWQLADQPGAQLAYLQSIATTAAAYPFAQRQRLQWLYQRYLDTTPNTDSREAFGNELETLLIQTLGVPRPPKVGLAAQPAETATDDVWPVWQAELIARLADWEAAGQTPNTAALLTLWLQILEDRTDGPNLALRHTLFMVGCQQALVAPGVQADQWQALLVSASLFWSQPNGVSAPIKLRDQVIDRLLTEALPEAQLQAVLAWHVPIHCREWEAAWEVDGWIATGPTETSAATDTRRLLRLYQRWWATLDTPEARQAATDPPSPTPTALRTLLRVRTDYAEFLWRIGSWEQAQKIFDSYPLGELRDRQVRARILSAQASVAAGDIEVAEAEVEWQRVTEQVSPGSPAWFEARYYRLRYQAAVAPEQAQMAYNQLRQLYPEIPPPWSTALSELAAEQGW